MIPDARGWLTRARDTFTTPEELAAIDEFLHLSDDIDAGLHVMEDGVVVWLFASGYSSMAVPFAQVPGLADFARESGDLEKFFMVLREETSKLLTGVSRTLFPEQHTDA